MLQEGDVIELKRGMRIYTNIPEHFVHANKQGCFDITHADVTLGRGLEYLYGKYIVYKTAFEGGGSNFDGSFPNGHHVFCVKADNEKIKTDFYQSGCFTAMIEDIQPMGKATLHWEYEEEEEND